MRTTIPLTSESINSFVFKWSKLYFNLRLYIVSHTKKTKSILTWTLNTKNSIFKFFLSFLCVSWRPKHHLTVYNVPGHQTQTCRQGSSWRFCHTDRKPADCKGELSVLQNTVLIIKDQQECKKMLTILQKLPPSLFSSTAHPQVVGSRGNNLHEAVTAQGETFLVSMPTKFRKNIWIKRGTGL